MLKPHYVPFIFLSLMACSSPKSTPETLKNDVQTLASDAFEGRQTGTPAEQKAANYIANRFDALGLEPLGTDGFFQTFNFKPSTDPHQETTFVEGEKEGYTQGTNVVGFLNNRAAQTVIIGAHYDHLGYGTESSLYRDSIPAIHNGADDNASGVATMLHLAGRTKELGTQNNYLFLAFSGEELGLLGSNYFIKNTPIADTSYNYMINMDMVGRLKEDKSLAVYGVGTAPVFKQTLTANNNFFKLIFNESGIGPSDHTSFYLADIPVLHFFTGQHEDYHKPSDDADKINYAGMEELSDYIIALVNDLDNNGKLSFRTTINESEATPRFSVSLGVVPDYLFDGEGMRIDGVSEGKVAQAVGLQKGDVVVGLGGEKVTNMMDYMKALSKFKKGDTTTVTINRSGASRTFDVVF
ncbi:MAG: M28 family peptidase [Flavobacteriaceae bacterium]